MREAAASGERVRAEEVLTVIRDCLERVRSGTVAVTIREGGLVQLGVTEQRRLAS